MPSSRLHYARSWKKFSCFCTLIGNTADLPISVPLLLWFIAHLFAGGAAPASIISVVAALSYFNKVNGFADPAKNFVVAKALAGARGMRSRFDIRLPVTGAILGRLVHALPIVFSCHYTCIIMKAMMVLAFAAFLGVGEMVPRTLSDDAHCLQYGDVPVGRDTISIIFRSFKHSNRQGPQLVSVSLGEITGSTLHAGRALQEFLAIRPSSAGVLFLLHDGSPMLRRQFDAWLKQLLTFCDLDTNQFKGHSFRIGAASAAALRGDSDAKIRAAGRWSSDAFKKYIRLV